MARIVLGSYMVRYPLGGMLSWVLQYIVGFQQLGHDVYFVEKAGYPDSCYDPIRDVKSDDCAYGTRVVGSLLARFGLGDRWCFADALGRYHGLDRERVQAVFDGADVFVDMGTRGAWLEEAERSGLRVLVDGEPGFTQMKMENRRAAGEDLPRYDAYYTTGRNIAAGTSAAPSGGQRWRSIFHPVVPELFDATAAHNGARFTTVMNWQSYARVSYGGRVYGHKDVEFRKFQDLPRRTSAHLELAVSGKSVPRTALAHAGWHLREAHDVTASFDSFRAYVAGSRGEFGVCKSGFVLTNSGWFSDRSAAYLASGKPVVLQETGFSEHLPCGEGLFAVDSADEAASVLEEIGSDYERHAQRAREIALDLLDARKVLGRFLEELGV
jgi:hypothetical protein